MSRPNPRRSICVWCGRLQWLEPGEKVCPFCWEDEDYQSVKRNNEIVSRRARVKKTISSLYRDFEE